MADKKKVARALASKMSAYERAKASGDEDYKRAPLTDAQQAAADAEKIYNENVAGINRLLKTGKSLSRPIISDEQNKELDQSSMRATELQAPTEAFLNRKKKKAEEK